MNKFRLYYFLAATVIGILIVMNFGLTGEGGIAAFYLTVALTFPVGLLVGYIISALSQVFNPNVVGLFFIPAAAVASYFQWVFVIWLYRKWKNRKAKEFEVALKNLDN